MLYQSINRQTLISSIEIDTKEPNSEILGNQQAGGVHIHTHILMGGIYEVSL
jgi:hypothetical protein